MPDIWRLSHLGDLALFLGGSDDSFTGDLLRLIAKADPGNRALLQRTFPAEVEAWTAWMSLDEPTAGALREQLPDRE
jgi:hypothetical protein